MQREAPGCPHKAGRASQQGLVGRAAKGGLHWSCIPAGLGVIPQFPTGMSNIVCTSYRDSPSPTISAIQTPTRDFATNLQLYGPIDLSQCKKDLQRVVRRIAVLTGEAYSHKGWSDGILGTSHPSTAHSFENSYSGWGSQTLPSPPPPQSDTSQ